MPEEAPVMRVRRGDMGGDFRAAIDGRDRDTRGTKDGRGGRQKRGGQGRPRQRNPRGGGKKRKIHPACGEGWIMMGMDVIT